MNLDELFSGSFLKAADLKGRTVKLVIDSVTVEEFDDGKKPVIHFAGKDKGLVMNKTNYQFIKKYYSENSENWKGKPLELFPEDVSFQGKLVEAIRVRVPQDAKAAQAAAPAASQDAPPADFDDDIPF